MQLTRPLLLTTLAAAAQAAEHTANVYIFSQTSRPAEQVPSLSREQAGLVLAGRLGISQYHSLRHAPAETISYINTYGNLAGLYDANGAASAPGQLLIIAEGWTSSIEKEFETALGQTSKPAFGISQPASAASNKQFVNDLNKQLSASLEPETCGMEDLLVSDSSCSNIYPSRVVHIDTSKSYTALLELANRLRSQATMLEDLDVILITMPESSRRIKSGHNPYGSYDMPSSVHARRNAIEDPLQDYDFEEGKVTTDASIPEYIPAASNKTIKGVVQVCHSSLDACVSATNNCTGHGSCYKKFGDDDGSCFTCGCVADFHKSVDKNGRSWTQTIYYGGAACQKVDKSSQFWLITSFSVVLVGLVSWAIGMLFSIGEERLPGVIGAGVSPVKAGGR